MPNIHRNFPGDAKASQPASFFTLPDATAPAGSTCNSPMSNRNNAYRWRWIYVRPLPVLTYCRWINKLAHWPPGSGMPTYAAGATAYSTQLAACSPILAPFPAPATKY